MNRYDLRYSNVHGSASDLYTEFLYGYISTFDFLRLANIFNANNMTDEAKEVTDELLDFIDNGGDDTECFDEGER